MAEDLFPRTVARTDPITTRGASKFRWNPPNLRDPRAPRAGAQLLSHLKASSRGYLQFSRGACSEGRRAAARPRRYNLIEVGHKHPPLNLNLRLKPKGVPWDPLPSRGASSPRFPPRMPGNDATIAAWDLMCFDKYLRFNHFTALLCYDLVSVGVPRLLPRECFPHLSAVRREPLAVPFTSPPPLLRPSYPPLPLPLSSNSLASVIAALVPSDGSRRFLQERKLL